jgi:hypothetical protein
MTTTRQRSTAQRLQRVSAAAAAAFALALTSTLVATASPTPAPGPPTTQAAPAAPAAPRGRAEVLSASKAKPRQCHARQVARRSTDGFAVTAAATGLVRVRLDPVNRKARSTDWDVAVFDVTDQRVVAASAGPRSYEVADGFVEAGDRLWVQGCRYQGRSKRVDVSVDFFPTPAPSAAGVAQLVSVATPARADKTRLLGLGLDVTESGDAAHVDVVLRDAADAATLRDAGLRWTVRIKNLRQHLEQVRRADRAYARSTAESALPSGRTTYRRLADYDYELKELARRHPGLVKHLILSERSYEGRDISGVEITRHPGRVHDGKPVFANVGVHHAREWPAGEHVMELAIDLVKGYGHDDRTTTLVRRTRTIAVPIVNPDGFSVSREATPLGDFSQFDYENKRKNCDPAGTDDPLLTTGPCPVNPAGVDRGTDLNRNYGAFWGGAGASPLWPDPTYRGPGPFSEPESRAVRDLVSERQVTNLITNHTYGNLVLRPPGVLGTGQPVDAPLLASLGREMTSHNRYANFLGFQLYDTSGTTDDWSYWVTGGLGYTFEIGPGDFHPDFRNGVVAEYLGLEPAAGAGRGGNREAYFSMLASTARAADHSTLTGKAPKGWTLRARKQFQTPTSPVLQPDGSTAPALLVADTLDTTFKAPGGRFRWAVNPSTRPYVAGRYGRTPAAPPQQAVTLTNPAGEPAENVGDPFTGPHEESTFTVSGLPEADNGTATVRVTWTDPADDWDVYILDGQGSLVAQAATFGENFEEATLIDPPPGTYRVVTVNYDQADDDAAFDDWSGAVSFGAPKPAVEGVRESWTLTCERPRGSIAASRQVVVDRGESVDLGSVCRRQKASAAAARR